MTIGVLADTIFPAVGGNGRTLERLATALAARGHRVVAYTACAAGGNPAPPGMTVHAVRALRVPGFRLPARWGLTTSSELARMFRGDGIDVLHVSTFYSPFGVAAAAACRRLRIPFIAHAQTQPEHALAHVALDRSPAVVHLVYRALVPRLERADAVLVASARAGALLTAHGYRGTPIVLANGLDVEFWAPGPARTRHNFGDVGGSATGGPADAAFQQKEQLGGRQVILSVSRLMKDKNLFLLLDGFRRLHADIPGTVLVLLGEGPERPRLERAAAAAGLTDAVRFPGWVERPEALRAWYRAASVFVLPSIVEIQSLALLEAMACAVPVVVTDAPANLSAELVTDGENGFRIAPNNPEDLAYRLRVLLTDPALRERLGSTARARVLVAHDLRRIIETLETIYASLIHP